MQAVENMYSIHLVCIDPILDTTGVMAIFVQHGQLSVGDTGINNSMKALINAC